MVALFEKPETPVPLSPKKALMARLTQAPLPAILPQAGASPDHVPLAPWVGSQLLDSCFSPPVSRSLLPLLASPLPASPRLRVLRVYCYLMSPPPSRLRAFASSRLCVKPCFAPFRLGVKPHWQGRIQPPSQQRAEFYSTSNWALLKIR